MSITPFEEKSEQPHLVGKVVKRVERGMDSGGYGYAIFEFTDGTTITIREESMSGCLSYKEEEA